MQEVSLEQGVQFALDAVHTGRLAVLCGAGLSIPSPSNLPGAASLAAEAKRKYDATYGISRDPLPDNIEEQAEFFFNRGELGTIYLRTLIDQHAFAGRPNAGHYAIADLLLVRGIQTAVSTNVDGLIETAGTMLFGEIGTGVDRDAVAIVHPDMSPLLKLHGCWRHDRENTVWAPGQLNVDPVAGRIASNKEWLATRLLDRDLLIVGYFTDWDYLNDVLAQTLGEVRPARVIVVDPNTEASLAGKAPALHALGDRATTSFLHVRESGNSFLERLRLEFSKGFVRSVLYAGSEEYEQMTNRTTNPAWKEPPEADCKTLWRVRRDLEGQPPNRPACERVPPPEPLIGLTLIQLRAAGAEAEGQYWVINGRRVRVLRATNQFLHRVQAAFAQDTAPITAPDVVVAVGADTIGLPSHIVRSGTHASIARGSDCEWLTRSDAVEELGL